MSAEKGPDYKVWYRPQYLNSICHVCKSIPENAIQCPNCHIITYCGIEHLEDDLDDHEELCDAFTMIAKVLKSDHALDKAYLLGAEQLRDFRLGVINLCSKHMQRQLLPWEIEVCLFPPLCATCHKFQPSTLISCPNCLHIKWCSPQHKPKHHEKFCQQLILYRKIIQKRLHIIPSIQIMSSLKTIDELPTINNDQIEFCLLTEVATSPLSVLNALSYQTESDNIIIHMIGPEPNFEANNLVKWETFLFNLLPATINYLHLVFIGPEIGAINSRTVCKMDRKLEFTFHQVLYHEYVKNNEKEKPNLIAVLNPGLYRTKGFQNMDTWSETISAIFLHPSVPVLITAYTEKEIKLDYKRVNEVINKLTALLPPCRNPFSSRRPLMNFVSDETSPVVYKNAYHTILCLK